MLHKIQYNQWQADLQRFMDHFQTPPKLALECFHPVQLPVVICEARINVSTVELSDPLSLLILRLYDAGIRTPEAIQSFCGLRLETVRACIHKEQFAFGHIDPATNTLTALGLQTLTANAGLPDYQARCCRNYETSLRLHIDPTTTSLIPTHLEQEAWQQVSANQNAGDFLLPRENAPMDQAFLQELNARLLADISQQLDKNTHCDAVESGNLIDSITDFRPIHIFYRWGYLVKFVGMSFPMLVFSGEPIVLSRSDKFYLQRNGIHFPNVPQRSDECFADLQEMIRDMTLTLPPEDPADWPAAEIPETSLAEPDWQELLREPQIPAEESAPEEEEVVET